MTRASENCPHNRPPPLSRAHRGIPKTQADSNHGPEDTFFSEKTRNISYHWACHQTSFSVRKTLTHSTIPEDTCLSKKALYHGHVMMMTYLYYYDAFYLFLQKQKRTSNRREQCRGISIFLVLFQGLSETERPLNSTRKIEIPLHTFLKPSRIRTFK